MKADDGSPTETIYVELLNEGTSAWRPTMGRRVGPQAFELLATPNYDPEHEEWQFVPGTVVRCNERVLSCGPVLVAVERVDDQPAR